MLLAEAQIVGVDNLLQLLRPRLFEGVMRDNFGVGQSEISARKMTRKVDTFHKPNMLFRSFITYNLVTGNIDFDHWTWKVLECM